MCTDICGEGACVTCVSSKNNGIMIEHVRSRLLGQCGERARPDSSTHSDRHIP